MPIVLITLLARLRRAPGRLVSRMPAGTDRQAGQATAEYALVLLGAAVIAIALITWATGSGRIGDLFDAVFDELQSRM
jgi:Flp pilus assembly pilin Flp